MASTWTATLADEEKKLTYEALADDISIDIAVIGGGITGTTAAYLLCKAGKSVALIDEKTALESTTAHTTGFLTAGVDTDAVALVRMIGEEKTRGIFSSTQEAIVETKRTVEEEKIGCEFTGTSSFIYPSSEADAEELERQSRIISRSGVSARFSGERRFPFARYGYLELLHQAKFHALKYILALKEKVRASGGLVFDKTAALRIESTPQAVVVHTKKGKISAQHIFIATYYPFTNPRQLFAHTGTYITYLLEFHVPRGVLPEATYQDTHNPYHYFRIDPQKDTDRLLLGGADHRKEIPMAPRKNYDALREYVRTLFPNVEMTERRRWKWGVLEPLDGIPYIGSTKEDSRIYTATGFSGVGLTMGRVAAQIVSDDILGIPNKWSSLYSLDRSPTMSSLWQKGKDYVGEFFGGAVKNMLR